MTRKPFAILALIVCGPCCLLGAEEAERTTVIGKYDSLVGEELRLYENPMRFILKDETLLRRVFQLRSQADNLKLVGRIVAAEGGEVFEVEELELASSDVEAFRKEIEGAPTAPGAERSSRLIDTVVRMARSQAKLADPEVGALLYELAPEVFRGAEAASAPEDRDAFLAKVQEVHELLQDRRLTYLLLVPLHASFPGQDAIKGLFRELGCRRHSGRWVTYDEFKRLEGFVLHEGRWLKEHERDMLLAVAEFHRTRQTTLILRRRTEKEYKLLAERGVVENGMKPDEVYRALGPPDRVERRGYAQKEFDQWIYGRDYFYFYDGLLVRTPRKEER